MTVGRVGPFVLEKALGSTGRGRAFRAVHEDQRKLVALKRISIPLLRGNAEAHQRLMNDFELLKKLDHPHLARSFGGFVLPQEACYAYELVHGETLADLLARRGRTSWEQAWDLLDRLAELLAYLHARDVYVGALLPDRIVLDPLGSPRLVSLTGQWGRERTRLRETERAFVAPEIRHEGAPSIKSDLFSLGALAYVCVTGSPPAAAEGPAGEPPSMAIEAPDCPFWLDRIVLQMLSPNPSSRPFNAGAVHLALQESQKRLAERVGVAEHAARGFSPIQVTAAQKDESFALKRYLKPEEKEDDDPQRSIPVLPIVGLSFVLIAMCAVISWALIPPSDAKRLESVAVMLASGHGNEIRQAKEILAPMMRRHPNDALTATVRERLDEAEMYLATEELRIRMEYDRPIRNEAERLYAEGLEKERLGDRIGALEQYRAVMELVDLNGEDRTFHLLAKRDAQSLERDGAGDEQVAYVKTRMVEAADLSAEGRIVDARKIWQSIVTLYRTDEHLRGVVNEAESYLRQTDDASP